MKEHPRAEPTGLRKFWHYFPLKTGHLWLDVFLVAAPIAVVLHFMHAAPLVTFSVACVAILPLAGVLGRATETLAHYSGQLVGGLLNATMGNATELIIAFFALRAGHLEVVKASLSGSIIGNLLLVLGLALLVGGWGRVKQTFSRTAASANSTMLFIAVAGLVMPAVYDLVVHRSLEHNDPQLQAFSMWTSGVLMAVYFASLLFMLKTHKKLFVAGPTGHAPGEEGHTEEEAPTESRGQALISMTVATIAIAYIAEILVGEIDAASKTLGLTELFIGVIVVAIVGNAAEHSTAIFVARSNKMDLALTIAIGSSTQIALFVAPVLVFASMIMDKPMSLVFNGFELAAIALSVFIVEMISSDGETNWFEGAQLLGLYVLLAIAFYYVPAR